MGALQHSGSRRHRVHLSLQARLRPGTPSTGTDNHPAVVTIRHAGPGDADMFRTITAAAYEKYIPRIGRAQGLGDRRTGRARAWRPSRRFRLDRKVPSRNPGRHGVVAVVVTRLPMEPSERGADPVGAGVDPLISLQLHARSARIGVRRTQD